MTFRYMLDTNTVSYIVKNLSRAARDKMLNLSDEETCCISVVTEAEIRYGLALRPEATALKTLMVEFLSNIDIVPWGSEEAIAYATIRAHLDKKGKTVENMDLMIAAHAVAIRAALVTNDHVFRQVEELDATVNWATDLPRRRH